MARSRSPSSLRNWLSECDKSRPSSAARTASPASAPAGYGISWLFTPEMVAKLRKRRIDADAQRVEIGLLAFGARGLWNRRDAVLVEQPFQRDLRRRRIVLPGNGNERLVVGSAALCQRAIGDKRN